MTHQEASAVVVAPLATVEQRLCDVSSWPQFMAGIESVSELAFQRFRFTVKANSGTREIDAAVLDHPREHRVSWRSLDGPRFEGEFRLSAVDDRHTSVHLSLQADPAGFLAGLSEMFGTSHSTATVSLQRLETYLAEATA